ncbi:MAG: UbiD family decarboxylase, partial [Candidatus Binatia bacterium]|nr:UbiD family decarboxylase [Candidatus Binatia bacterium]
AKNVIVVDEDVSLDGESEVWWALSTRFRAGEHLWVEQGGRRMSIDPSSQDASVARMGIDATAVGEGAERYRKVEIDGTVRDKVRHLLRPYL